MKKTMIRFSIIAFLLIISIIAQGDVYLWVSPISKDRMKLLPQTFDYRNYFFLQSIDDTTSIFIGDFTRPEKLIVQIVDENSDNTIDRVYEYYPDTNMLKIKRNSSVSTFFRENIAELKRDIISGKLFRETYSYRMFSMDTVNYLLENSINVFPEDKGYAVKFADPDKPTTPMGEFYFKKNQSRYDLQFKTNYYKIFNLSIDTPIPYSVYCKNSKDPVVVEAVESLLKQVVR